MISNELLWHTQAIEASRTVPSVQKDENTTIQVPLCGAGINSRNQDESTGPPPKPIPTIPRKMISTVRFGENALRKPAPEVIIAVMRNPFLHEQMDRQKSY